MHSESKTYHGLLRLKELGFQPSGVLDIGAYDGMWARSARSIFSNAHITMIDALAEKMPILSEVAGRIGNASIGIALLGDCEKDGVEFHVVNAGSDQTGSSKYKENTLFPRSVRIVRQRTLDGILFGRPQSYEMIKIDAQGAELDIISGGERVVKNAEVVLMEVATLPYNQNAPQMAEVVLRMKRLGFVLFDFLDELRLRNGTFFQCDVLFIREDSKLRPQPPY